MTFAPDPGPRRQPQYAPNYPGTGTPSPSTPTTPATPGTGNDPNSPINIPPGFQYSAPNYGLYQDYSSLSSPSLGVGNLDAPAEPRFTVIREPMGMKGVSYWRVEFHSSTAGYRPRGRFDEVHAARAWSSMDGRRKGLEHLPPASTAVTNLDPGDATYKYLSPVNAFGSLAFGMFNTTGANYSPIYRASAATLTQLTYSKATGHRIRGLVNLIVNGSPYVAVLKTGLPTSGTSQPIELLSDLANTPTSAGSMHADTGGANGGSWAAVNTTLPDSSILIFNASSVLALAYNSAIGAQPTVVGRFPVGGAGFGAKLGAINNGPLEVFVCALAPEASGSAFVPGGGPLNFQGAIYRLNQRGSDVRQFPTQTRFISQFDMYRDGLIYIDNELRRCIFDNGRYHFDLPVQRNRNRFWLSEAPDLIGAPYVNALAKRGDDLYLELSNTTFDGRVVRWMEYLDFNSRELLNASGPKYYTAPASVWSAQSHGSLPVDAQTGNIWTWFSPATGANFWCVPQPTEAAAVGDAGMVTEASGVTLRPAMEIPGLEGKPKTWHRAFFGGVLSPIGEGGIYNLAASLQLDIGGTAVVGTDDFIYQSETFTGGLNMASRWRRRTHNRNRFWQLIVKETLTAGTVPVFGTDYPYHFGDNVTPYSIEGLCYDDDAAFEKWGKSGRVTWS